ncbi:MAG: ribonuclease HII [Candidatus Eisenbacteria bacterium]
MNLSRWRHLACEEARMAGECVTVAGVDEAGRGPLAGPVVAAAVVLDVSYEWEGLDDSKQMSAAARDCAYARVLQGARAFAWAVVGPRTIDRVNIRMATHGAMAQAVRRLRLRPDLVLIDGHETVAALALQQRAVVKGDGTCLSIAAASVLAKVVRDRIMTRLDRVWPAYGFAKHKGYGSAEHMAAIREHGPCPAHRFSFAPVREMELPLY